MQAAGIPTAEYEAFTELAPAVAYARARGGRVVVKADGLAAGKGVVVCGDAGEAEEALRAMLVGGAHGAAGRKVVVEERLEGPEASCIAFTDGERVRMLAAAQDHKRIFDGDRGPNTGGMGAFSPTPNVGPELLADVERNVIVPAVRELARRGRTVPRRALRGPHAHAEGAARARVQRAPRRSRDAADPHAPAERHRPGAARRREGRPVRRDPRVRPARRRRRRARGRGVPGAGRERRRHRGRGRLVRRRRAGVPRRDGPRRRRGAW